ncbi:MAG: tRNA (adenosine(37)-N6)-dimethylallyltransferase MiaA [Rhodobacteraceae bacterium]|nr:tRNA (adenosine(37)-N6)-dimethylallyltransferase MiaA [Paracoccaceae bacterium]
MNRSPPRVPAACQAILIAGTTASGKSGLANCYAHATDGLIVNADALQVYSCWRILTARPTAEDEKRHDHALYGHVDYAEPYSVGSWLHEVDALRKQNPGRLLIIVGGTGLYLTSLLSGLAPIPAIDDTTRRKANAIVAASGLAALRDELIAVDPDTAAIIDMNNPARLQRAWSVWHSTGKGMAAWHSETAPPLFARESVLSVVIECERTRLADRIAARLDSMITQGLLDECRNIRPRWDPDLPASRALGAAEIMAHLGGRMTLEAALSAAGQATRRYAKRQRTWLRNRMTGWLRIEADMTEHIHGRRP